MAVGSVWRTRWARTACLLIMGGGAFGQARAGEIWDGGSLIDNRWTTAENWMPPGPPANDGTANVLMMGPGHADSLVDVPWNIRSMQFPAGAVGFSITGSALSLGEGGISNFSGAPQGIANDIVLTAAQSWEISSNVSMSGAIGGSFGLTKTGDGALMFGGATANSYTGITTVNAGTLLLNKSVANGALNGGLTIGDGAGGAGSDVVRWVAGEQVWHGAGSVVSINSSGLMDLNGFSETIRDLNLTEGQVTSGAGMLTVLGTISSNASAANPSFIADRLSLGSGTRVINVADGLVENDLVISASIVSGGLTKGGAGALLMIGPANTYLGTTTVLDGALVLAKNGVDGAIRGDLVIGGGAAALTVVMQGANEQIQAVGNTVTIQSNGVLAQNGFGETIGDLEMAGGQISGGMLTVLGEVSGLASDGTALIASNLNLGGINRNFNIADGTPATDVEISGVISNGGLVKTGPGTLLLNGSAGSNNNYIGPTMVNQGVLVLNKLVVDGTIDGNLVIGDGAGGVNADVVRLEADEQIVPNGWNWVTVRSSGLFELAGHVETISNLAISGGNITTGPSSSGLLRVLGDVVSNPAAVSGTISGRMDLSGGVRTFNIADGAAANDLSITAIISNGGITKTGAGKLRLLGNLFAGGFALMQGGVVVTSDFSLGIGTVTLVGGMIESEGAPTLSNAVRIEGPAAVGGNASLNLNGPIISGNVLSKRGAGVLTISGSQSNGPGAGLDVLAGRVNLNSDAGVAASANAAANADLVLRIGKGEAIGSLVVLGANQELAGLEVAASTFSDAQGLDLNSPPDAGAFRAVKVYAADLAAAKNSIYAAIRSANADGAADPHDGIFDSGLSAHPGSRIGMGIVNDAHGDAHVLVRPTKVGDLNLDGVVTISDFIDLASNFDQLQGMTWQEGDLNYDGAVTISDFIDLAANFNTAYGPSVVNAEGWEVIQQFAQGHGAAVPEPGMILLALGGALVLARRRRCGFEISDRQ
ncbi:MAG TPA: autotransporter-associated beta strand repeat-containing protein [Tepidisphaeraceae bacterium]|nr:autotransporter-associated beta strand repeat-containing protein [Tepidisphaeraceae bacterium]